MFRAKACGNIERHRELGDNGKKQECASALKWSGLSCWPCCRPWPCAAAAGKKLPERTSLEAFIAFIDQAIGETEFAAAKPNLPLGPGYSINTRGRELEFSENVLAGKTAPEVMAQLLKNYGAWCEGLKSEPLTQQEFGGVSLARVAITCNALNHDNYAEAVVIADDARFQAYDYGGFAENKDKTVAVGERLTAALTAAYR